MKNKKTLIKAVKSLFLILAMAVCVIGFKPLVCEAYTPKSLNKEIKKVTKQLKTLEKKDKLQSKGCVSFWGTIINRDPLIIKKIGLTPTYYWVNNPQNVNITLTNVTGDAIDTGKTKVFEAGGLKYTCKVVNAKKTNSKLTSKIVSLRNKLTRLKNTKKNRWFITYDSINLVKGAKYNATYNGFWLYKEAYPQKLSFSSSKKSVAAVNKRTGLITAKKLGSATITMKAKASGKKVKLRINVVPPSIRFKQATYEFGAGAYKKTGNLDFNYCSISRDINISIGDTSIISSAEKTAEGIRCTYTGKVGQTTITLKIKEGMSATCTVIVKESKNEDSENAKNSVTAVDPTTHTHQMKMESDDDYHWEQCVVCGEIQGKEEHIWNWDEEESYEATEDEEGLAVYYCKKCDIKRVSELPRKQHKCYDYLKVVPAKEATCIEEGNVRYYKCTLCNTLYKDSYPLEEIEDLSEVTVSKKGHNFSDKWNSDDNYHWKTCLVCGAIDDLTKQLHIWNDGEIVLMPTETEKGCIKYTCIGCGKTQEKEIKALGHKCANHLTKVNEKNATCNKEGNVLYYTCECGKWYYDQEAKEEITNHNDVIKAKIAHSYGGEWTKDANYHWKICSVCGEEDKQDHTWDAGEVITEPTETETGLVKYTCTTCGETKEEEIKALGHICANHLTKVEEKAPTCEEEGNIHYYICECGKWYYDQKAKEEIMNHNDVVKAQIAHSYGDEWEKDEEYHWRACSACGKTDDLTKQEHIWDAGEVITEPTETEPGLMKHTCTTCGETKEEEIKALGHICANHLTKVEEKAPTCEEEGNIRYYICECGKWYYDQDAKKEITNHNDVVVYGGLYKEENGEKKLVYTWNELIEKNIVNVSDKGDYYCNYTQIDEIKGAHLIIPKGITSIGKGAFYNCRNLVSISIPKGVTSIGESAFMGCDNLTSISIPEGVTSIGKGAFYNCSNLVSISIPKGVTSIGESAFEGCANLTSISIPEGVTSIGESAFYECRNLVSISIPEGITSIEGSLFSRCNKLTSISIPEGVISIGDEAFRACGELTSINVPESVTSIGEGAFSVCSNLTSISIPEGVTNIGEGAFSACSRLINIEVNRNNKSYRSENNCIIEQTQNVLVAGCKTSVIPEGVTSIGDYAFYSCDELTSVNIPEGVTSIGDYAFSDCDGLTSVNIPEGVLSIGKGAFVSCSELTNVSISSGVVSMGDNVFNACCKLTSINIPEGVTSIGNNAFDGCRELTNINIPESVTSIGNQAFYGCYRLTSISIPERVTSIGNQAFSACYSLVSIIVDKNNKNYRSENNCIIDCEQNKLVIGCNATVIPEGITSIGESAFCGCDGLTSVNIPEGVTSIGDYAFDRCRELTNINIPESVTSIGNQAFYGCSKLTKIEWKGKIYTSVDSFLSAFSQSNG